MMGKAVTCPQPGLLCQHVSVPCLPMGMVPLLSICYGAVMGMAKGTKEPCRKLFPLGGMCPQPAPREAEGSPQGSELHQALLSQGSGETTEHRLSMSCASVATVPQHSSPILFHQSSSQAVSTISTSYRHRAQSDCPKREPTPGDGAAQSLRQLRCSPNIHPLRIVGADSQVNTKPQLSPWAQQ